MRGSLLVPLCAVAPGPPRPGVFLDSVPAHRAGTASGVFDTFRRTGGSPLVVRTAAAGLALRGSTDVPGSR
ncbi:hypothetical protein L3i22_042040 [Actinoplanes sp. L3-i22]|nr:hypothetical protein L3i22_042040 [Actinoplanes sp. L3-i22]